MRDGNRTCTAAPPVPRAIPGTAAMCVSCDKKVVSRDSPEAAPQKFHMGAPPHCGGSPLDVVAPIHAYRLDGGNHIHAKNREGRWWIREGGMGQYGVSGAR